MIGPAIGILLIILSIVSVRAIRRAQAGRPESADVSSKTQPDADSTKPDPPPKPAPAPVATPRVVPSKSTSWFGWILIIGLIVGVIYLVKTKDSRQVSVPAPQTTARIADLIVLPPGEGQVDIKFTLSASDLDRDALSMYQDPGQGWQQIRLFVNGSQDPSWQWHALTGKGIARYRGIKKFLKAGENVLTIQHRLEKKPVMLKNIFLDKT